jgi:hypothetical protein
MRLWYGLIGAACALSALVIVRLRLDVNKLLGKLAS